MKNNDDNDSTTSNNSFSFLPIFTNDDQRLTTSPAIIWYTFKRSILCALASMALFILIWKKMFFLITLYSIFNCILLAKPKLYPRLVAFILDIVCCSSILFMDWLPTIIISCRHFKNDLKTNPLLNENSIVNRIRFLIRQLLLIISIYSIVNLLIKNHPNWMRMYFLIILFTFVVNFSQALAIYCLRISPAMLNFDNVLSELSSNGYVGEYLAITTLNAKCKLGDDSELYTKKLWPALANCLVFDASVLNAHRIRTLCCLITKSYRSDQLGVVQLQLASYIEKLIELRQQHINSEIQYELTRCLQAIYFRFGSSLESCGVDKRQIALLKKLTYTKSTC